MRPNIRLIIGGLLLVYGLLLLGFGLLGHDRLGAAPDRLRADIVAGGALVAIGALSLLLKASRARH